MLHSLLAAFLAVDGGTIYDSCPDVSAAEEAFALERDGGAFARVAPDGGNDWLLPHPRGPRISCRLEICEDALSKSAPIQISGSTIAVAGIAFAAGLVAGTVLVCRATDCLKR